MLPSRKPKLASAVEYSLAVRKLNGAETAIDRCEIHLDTAYYYTCIIREVGSINFASIVTLNRSNVQGL